MFPMVSMNLEHQSMFKSQHCYIDSLLLNENTLVISFFNTSPGAPT